MKDVIEKYFNAWLNKDGTYLVDIFAENVVYSECYGPEYFGLQQVMQWFYDWNIHGNVLKWDRKQFIFQANICVTEWEFKCEYNKEISEFNGVSIIEFDEQLKIINLKEFKSQKEHIYPYGKMNAK